MIKSRSEAGVRGARAGAAPPAAARGQAGAVSRREGPGGRRCFHAAGASRTRYGAIYRSKVQLE